MTCGTKKTFDIIQGESVLIPIRLISTDGEPKDLTDALDPVGTIKAFFIKSDGTRLEKTVDNADVLNALAGKFSIRLTPTDTESLEVGNRQSFEVEITENIGQPAESVDIVQFIEVLNVDARIE